MFFELLFVFDVVIYEKQTKNKQKMNNPIVLAIKNEIPSEATRMYTLMWAKMFRSPIIIHNVVSIPQYIMSDAMLGGNSLASTVANKLGENQVLLRSKKIITALEEELKEH